MKTALKRFAVIQPLGRAPYKGRAELNYRNNKELTTQLAAYARNLWPAPQKIHVDTIAHQIIVDGQTRANFSLHEPRP